MITVAIPNWNLQGVLPPFNTLTPTSTDRSPYTVTLTDFVLRFGTTPKRQSILTGFLEFRSVLHSVGLTTGFQWVNGSFLENIETIENRHPADIDLVTFFHLPIGQTQTSLHKNNQSLFSHSLNKQNFHVDAYFITLNNNTPESLIGNSTYWYSMWSHRRNEQWKGYLQIDLSPEDDRSAKTNLDKMSNLGGQP